jgi:hypothetical protein
MTKNNISIIAIINYNQKNYGIYQRNENIEYAIIHNGKFEFKLESKEKEILDKCYDLIRYNSNYSIYCGNYKIKQKEFEIYQDTRSKLYTFVLKKNNKRYIPEKEDAILLNTYFNDEKFVYYASKQQNNKTTKAMKFFKRILIEGTMGVVALISTAVLNYHIPQNVKSNVDYEIKKILRSDLTKQDKTYTFDDIKTAIDSNDNISEEEKEFIKEVFEAEFEENKEYMCLESIIRKIKTFKTQYDKSYTHNEKTTDNEVPQEKLLTSVTGYYFMPFNKITFLKEEDTETKKEELFGFKEVKKSIYYHEFNHLLTKYGMDIISTQLSEEVIAMENEETKRNQHGNL